ECGQRAGSTERLVRCVAHLLTQVSALRLEDADVPAGVSELGAGLGAATAGGLPRGTVPVPVITHPGQLGGQDVKPVEDLGVERTVFVGQIVASGERDRDVVNDVPVTVGELGHGVVPLAADVSRVGFRLRA